MIRNLTKNSQRMEKIVDKHITRREHIVNSIQFSDLVIYNCANVLTLLA